MRRGWGVFHVRGSSDILAEQVVVMIIKGGNIDIQRLAEEMAVPQFGAIKLFRREVWVGVESRQIGRPVRQYPDQTQEIEILLGVGRRAQGVRKSGPDGLLLAGRPEKPCAWFRIGAGKIGPKQFRAYDQRKAAIHQPDFILHERREEIVGPLEGQELQP